MRMWPQMRRWAEQELIAHYRRTNPLVQRASLTILDREGNPFDTL